MKVDYTEEIQKSSLDVSGHRAKEAVKGTDAAARTESVGAVFEDGLKSHYIEKDKRDDRDDAKTQTKQAGNTVKQLQEQLAALTNSMSEEDLAQLKEEIDNLQDEDIHTIVTVQEKIKAKMAAYCEDYRGTLDLSDSELQQIQGLPGNAKQLAQKLKEADLPVTRENVENMQQALQMAEGFTDLPNQAKAALIKDSNQEITIENLYLAFYSSHAAGGYQGATGSYYSQTESGYITENAGGIEIEQLESQIAHILESEGLEADEETLKSAKWLAQNQLPITKETVERAKQLDNLQFPLDEEALVDKITDAITEGKLPKQAVIVEATTEPSMSYEEAAQLLDSLTEPQISKALEQSDGELTLGALKQAADHEEAKADAVAAASVVKVDSLAVLTARRQLEQIRLQMTMEAVGQMEKQGIHIDTQPLQELVSQLEKLESQYMEKQLTAAGVEVNEQTMAMYQQVNTSLEVIKQSPAAVLGVAAFDEEKQNFEAFTKECTVQAQQYQNAEKSYEAMMTKPNSDLGDSIQMAFRNVDDILKQMNLETSEYNRRAVRILGYNGMEVTKENIASVKTLDISVQRMLNSMTPSTVVKMIRDHYNPLQASVSEINEKLDSYKEQGLVKEERYSEYLWKLERQNGITPEERDSYIGIYRLLNQIEISDGALIGALYAQGAGLTMGNLLSAACTARKQGTIDYQIDDEFAGVEKNGSLGKISNQIEQAFLMQEQSFYKELASHTLDSLNPKPIAEFMEQETFEDMTFEEFAKGIENQAEDEEIEAAWRQEQLSRMQESADVEEKVLQLLSDYELPVTYQYLDAAKEMLYQHGSWAKSLQKLLKNGETDTLEEWTNELLQQFDSQEEAAASYDKYMKSCIEYTLEAAVEETDTYLDIRTMKLLSSQLRVASDMGQKEFYQIPVQIGEETVAINLKFVQKRRAQKVFISMQTEAYGTINVEFSVANQLVKGYALCSNEQGLEMLKQRQEPFARHIKKNEGLTLLSFSYVKHEDLNIQDTFSEKTGKAGKETTAAQLYQVAKTFIGILRFEPEG